MVLLLVAGLACSGGIRVHTIAGVVPRILIVVLRCGHDGSPRLLDVLAENFLCFALTFFLADSALQSRRSFFARGPVTTVFHDAVRLRHCPAVQLIFASGAKFLADGFSVYLQVLNGCDGFLGLLHKGSNLWSAVQAIHRCVFVASFDFWDRRSGRCLFGRTSIICEVLNGAGFCAWLESRTVYQGSSKQENEG